MNTKDQFDFLFHEVSRDIDTLRKAKGRNPDYVDDYVRGLIDHIRLELNLIEGENL